MKVYRRSSWLFFLLGLLFLTATLSDAQGEVDGQGPTESECRPYIEKALKELEGEISEHPDIDSNSRDSVEELPTIEITNDDSGHSEEDGIPRDSSEVNETDLDDSKEDEEEQTGEIDDDDESNEEETIVEETQQENESKENEISVENQEIIIEEHQDARSSEKDDTNEDEREGKEEERRDDETVIDSNLSDEQQGENLDSLEDENATDEDTSVEEEILDIREREILNSIEVYLEEEEPILTSREREILNSNDDDEILSRVVRDISSREEESVTSVEKEERATSAEQEGATPSVTIDENDSVERATESDKEESAETSTKSEEQDEGAATSVEKEETETSTEAVSVEKESETTATEDDTASTEKEDSSTSADKEDSGASEEKEESPKSEEKDENEASIEDGIPSEEKEKSVEVAGALSTEKEASQSEEKGDSAASGEKEDVVASEEEEGGVVSVEKVESAVSLEQDDGAASIEKNESVTSVEKEETPSAQKESSEKEQGATSVEEEIEVVAKNITGVDKKAPTSSTRATEDEEKTDSGEKVQEKIDSVVEELVQELEELADLRPRDHVNQILKLDEESTETELVATKLSDVILKDLKKLYENAIKPLETLYKYRDLSNRHFGDAEIFSKPLILFMGPWSGGKSSIINYLLDIEYNETSLHTGAEPSPAYFNIIMHGDEPEILDGTELAAHYTFSGLQKFGQGLEERLRGLKLPSKLLEKVNIVEIPGILEVRKQVSRVFPFNDACQWFIDRADIIFLVYDPSKLDVGPETEAILDQLKGREYQTRIVLNKADQIKPEELMRVQGALIWNISPLMSSAQPPIMYTTSLWSRPYESWAPVRLLQAQERAFLKDLRLAVEKRIDNKIASARRFAVRVRNHAKMVDCYLTTYYNHKTVFGNRKHVSDEIINHPQDYHIYEGLSTLTNISRYDLPDPDVYKDFFKLNALYEFQQLSATCTYFRGCPINRLDVAIAYDLPELVGKHKRLIETTLNKLNTAPTPDS